MPALHPSSSDTWPPPQLYTLPLHAALPIYNHEVGARGRHEVAFDLLDFIGAHQADEIEQVERDFVARSEEHTSELQSRGHLVCRLLLEKKKDEEGAGVRHRHERPTPRACKQ